MVGKEKDEIYSQYTVRYDGERVKPSRALHGHNRSSFAFSKHTLRSQSVKVVYIVQSVLREDLYPRYTPKK